MSGLNVHRWGPADAPVLLHIHGVANIGARYRRVAEEELPEVRVLAPDLRGHGDSTWDPPWDVATHLADLLETLDAEGVERAAVAGHSFGGLLAMRLAAAAPGRVLGLALLDPAVATAPGRCLERAEAVRRDEGWASVEDARAARLALRPPGGRAGESVEEDLRTFLAEGPDGRYRFRFLRSAVVTAWSEMAQPPPPLGAYAGPVVLVPGIREDYVTDALRASLRRDAGPRLRERPVDAGHMVFWDAQEEVGAILRDLVAEAYGTGTDASRGS